MCGQSGLHFRQVYCTSTNGLSGTVPGSNVGDVANLSLNSNLVLADYGASGTLTFGGTFNGAAGSQNIGITPLGSITFSGGITGVSSVTDSTPNGNILNLGNASPTGTSNGSLFSQRLLKG